MDRIVKVLLAITVFTLSSLSVARPLWVKDDIKLLGGDTQGAHRQIFYDTFLSDANPHDAELLSRASGDRLYTLRKYEGLVDIPVHSDRDFDRIVMYFDYLFEADYDGLEKIMEERDKHLIDKERKSPFFPNYVLSNQKRANENVRYNAFRDSVIEVYEQEIAFPTQNIRVSPIGSLKPQLILPYKRRISNNGVLMSVGFVGKQVRTLYYNDRNRKRYALTLGAGFDKLDEYLDAVTKSLKTKRHVSGCGADVDAEVNWRLSPYAKFTHPSMAKTLAKADLSSVHDYNINMAKYVEGRTLFVRSKAAANKLRNRLSQLGVKYGGIRVAGPQDDFGARPLDDTYFAVERTSQEIEAVKEDIFGYNAVLDGFYKYRYGLIRDVRFVTDKEKRHPIDGFFQKIAMDRAVRDCMISHH